MHAFKINDPDIHHEFMQGNFRVTKNESPFCANWSELRYRTRQQVDEGSGRTQKLAAMAR